MKCYYRIGDGEWIKGEIVSMSGGTEINLHSRDQHGRVVHEIALTSSPEVLFHGPYMTVTGYVPKRKPGNPDTPWKNGEHEQDENNNYLYTLQSVDVSGGWVKPKI